MIMFHIMWLPCSRFGYSLQHVNVRWHNVLSGSFCINNGTRQGGIMSPYLFTRYISEANLVVVNTRILDVILEVRWLIF